MTRPSDAPRIERITVRALSIPSERPESDGTFAWSSTTLVTTEITAGHQQGLGWTYAHAAAANVAKTTLWEAIRGRDALDVGAAWLAMLGAVRNIGRQGIAACAISAIDVALWDLKARLLDLPLVKLLGQVRDRVPLYGSGGFTSQTTRELCEQLGGWIEQGFTRVKMKVGREPSEDRARVGLARRAIGDDPELFVDANGAYDRSQALDHARAFDELGVSWFEEPVTSDDLEGLRLVRALAPPGLRITAGEYGWDPWYFQQMLAAGAVDVLQADATRCLGITGFLRAAALCQARSLPLSSHCAPYLHLAVACAAENLIHSEWFHDHVRIEQALFDGTPAPAAGTLEPDLSRPGHGYELKRADARRFEIAPEAA